MYLKTWPAYVELLIHIDIVSNTIEFCISTPFFCPSSDSFHLSLSMSRDLFWKLKGEVQVELSSPFHILISLFKQVY